MTSAQGVTLGLGSRDDDDDDVCACLVIAFQRHRSMVCAKELSANIYLKP